MKALPGISLLIVAALAITLVVPFSGAQAQLFPVHPNRIAIPNTAKIPVVHPHRPPAAGPRSAALSPHPSRHALRAQVAGAQAVGCGSGSGQPAPIAALVSALKCDPDLIFEYIYNNIEYEPLYGSNKGPLGTFLDRRGDDADQVILLVTLWNAAGLTQTGYFSGYLALEGSWIASWLGVPNDAAAIENLLSDGGIPWSDPYVNPDGSLAYISVLHFWAALQLDGIWYYFDPSYKQHSILSGVSDLASALGYSRSQFLSDAGGTIGSVSISDVNRANVRADLFEYANNLVTSIGQNNRAWSLGNVVGGKSIEPLVGSPIRDQMPDVMPENTFPVDCPYQTFECRTFLTITMPGASPSQAIKLYTDQVYGHRITVFSIPSGSNYIPTLLIDGAVPSCVGLGTCTNVGTPEPAGTTWSIPVAVTEPYQSTNIGGACPVGVTATACKNLTVAAGGSYLIGVGTGQAERGMPEYHRQLLAQARAAGYSDSSELVLGESLAVIGFNWLGQVSSEQQLTDQLAGTTTLYNFGVGIIGETNIQQAGYQGPYVDLPLNLQYVQPQSSTGPTTTIDGQTYPTAFVSAAVTHSETSSAFESAVLLQTQAPVAGMTAASTMVLVDDNMNSSFPGALQQTFFADGTTCAGQTAFTSTIEPAISPHYDVADYNNIVAAVMAGSSNCPGTPPTGQQVLIPQNGQLAVGSWTGAGYTEIFPQSSLVTFTQKISGGMSGGFSGTSVPDPAPNTQVTLTPSTATDTVSSVLVTTPVPSNPEVAEPVDGVTGAYIYKHADLVTGSGNFPYSLPFSRTYLSSSGSYLTTTDADVGMGNGWANTYSINAQVESDPYSSLGPSDAPAVDAATSIAALYVMQDLLSITPAAQTMTLSSMVGRWFADQLVGNMVAVSQPNTTEEFIALPHGDGSTDFAFSPPPGSATRFTQLASGQYSYVRKDGVTLNFGPTPAGALQGWLYPNGMSVDLTYSGSQLMQVANNLGRSLSVSYSGTDISAVTDDTGRSVTYSYDGNHNLTAFTDPLGAQTTYSYDTSGAFDTAAHLTQIFYPFQPTNPFVTNWYDPLGRVIQQANANGYQSSLYFAGSRTETDDALGDQHVTYQTDRGKVLSDAWVLSNTGICNPTYTSVCDVFNDTTQQNGIVNITTNEYDGIDRLTLTTLPEGGTTAYSYATAVNPWANNIASVTRTAKPGSPLSPLTTNFSYDYLWNKPNSVTDPLGLVTTMNYDPLTGNLLSIDADQGPSPHFNASASFTYDAYGRVLVASDPRGVITTFSYDAYENLISQVADSGTGRLNVTTLFGYDALGDVVSRTDPNGNTATMSYDADRRPLTATGPPPFNNDPLLVQTTNTYDPDGHVLTVTRSDSSSNVVTNFGYTITGKVASITDPNGNVTRNTYDADDRLAAVTDPVGRTTGYAYDAMSRRTGVSNTAIQSGPLTQFAYTPDGLVGSLTDANSNTTSFTPDGFDRLSTTTWPDTSTENLTYDADSNVLTRQTRAGATITFTYDTLNRLSTKTPPSPWPAVTYAYDIAGTLIGVSDTSAAIATPTAAASYTTNVTYDQLNRPINETWNPAPSQTTPTASSVIFGYGYDATNRRISQTATDNSWWNYPSAASSVSYTANDLNQYSAVGSASPTYDGNGDLAYDGTFTYCYDTESRLTGILSSGSCASPGTTVASYVYDAQGRRKSKTVGSTKTLYVTDADNREVLEYDGTTGAIDNWYSYAPAVSLGLDAVLNQMNIVAGTRQTQIPDIQGSIAATLDSGTSALTKIGYQSFGEHPSLAAGSYRYTARRYDSETAGSTSQPSGLYYSRARTYSPTWGRFFQPDPIGYQAGANLYAYVNSDPLNLLDPYGLAADSPQGALAGFENYLSESAEALSEIPSDVAAMTPADMLGYTQSALLGVGIATPGMVLGEATEVLGAEGAESVVGGSGALVPMAEAAFNTGTIRTIAGYEIGGNAGLVGSTYNMNIWGLYATEGAQGLSALANAFKAEASTAGASNISITGNAIINPGIANMNPAVASRFGFTFSQINPATIILQGPVP